MPTSELPTVRGLLFIGDPHLEARVPGFRKDDYPQVALKKFRWALQYARQHHLQPILLGDLFQLPQDNPNWLLSAIIESIEEPLPAIYGNHDIRDNTMKPNDSIHILFAGGHLQRLSEESPWRGMIDGRRVVVGGTVWGERMPKSLPADESCELAVWITHHDILIPGYEEAGRIKPIELPGIDLIVNGHVHRRLDPVNKGATHWITAGNITRRARSDASRTHRPAVVCLYPYNHSDDECSPDTYRFRSHHDEHWQLQWVTVPHESFDEVFYPEVKADEFEVSTESGFVADLRELTARRTDTGAGLNAYLQRHVQQFEPAVASEIMRLAREVADIQ